MRFGILSGHRQARADLRAAVSKLLARLIAGAGDEQLEHRFGSGVAQRALFAGMARSFESEVAAGLEGSLVYELSRPATGAAALVWTLEIADGRATARPGPAADPVLTLRFQLSDFLRMAAGMLDPAIPVLRNRAGFDGDLALAARLPEMFGVPAPH